MRSYKKIMPLLLAIALFGSAAFSIHGRIEKQDSYRAEMTMARDFAEKGIVADAITHYEAAITANPTLEAYVEAGRVYLDNEDFGNARKWYNNKLRRLFPKEPDTYLFGIDLYLSRNNYRMAYEVYDDYLGRELHSDTVEAAMDPIRYRYDLVGGYDAVSPFSTASKTAAVSHEGAWGYIAYDTDRVIPFVFQEANTFGTYAAVLDRTGKAYYIDTKGNIKINENVILDADPDFGQVVRFQSIQSGLVLAYNGEIWNYYKLDTFEKEFGGFKNALPIVNGVGAVSEDGEKWALISPQGEILTDAVYDEILTDGKGVMCRSDAIFAKRGSMYYLLDKQGKAIGSDSFAAADAFNENSLAAVKKDGRWIYIDASGKEVLAVDCDEARSFSNGMAAIKRSGAWGYINRNGEEVIPCSFVEAEPFSAHGSAFVKINDTTWKLLELYQYNHG